uniref:Uncharacterized protein n=1 Tax=Chlamydomonas leiostraca TaxID=1034604 RepID=A0A7S0N6T9_9CHLO
MSREAAAPVPARRTVTVPPQAAIQDLMCPDEETILQQLRNTKKEILRRGGDVRYAATLLLASPHRAHPASPVRAHADEGENAAPMAISPAPTPAPPSAMKAQRSKIPTMVLGSKAGNDMAAAAQPLADRSNA